MIKISHCFLALLAVLLAGCGASSSTPSKNDIEMAIRSYVGMAKPDIGDVKLDELKILKEYTQKVGEDDVFYRQFEAHYTVTYQNNPSKHTFEGTVAMAKQGGQWVRKNELCTLTFAYSPPVVDAATQAAMEREATIYKAQRDEEQKKRSAEQPAKNQPNQP